MTIIALVRHGKSRSRFGQPDMGLADKGVAQAYTAISALRPLQPFKLVSSPLPRAYATATIIAAEFGIPFCTDGRLAEVGDAALAAAERRTWTRAFLDAEWVTLDRDMLTWRDAIVGVARSCTTNTVLVTHFAVINAVVSFVMRSPRTMVFAPLHGSVTLVEVRNGALTLIAFGAYREWRP